MDLNRLVDDIEEFIIRLDDQGFDWKNCSTFDLFLLWKEQTRLVLTDAFYVMKSLEHLDYLKWRSEMDVVRHFHKKTR